MTPLQLIFHCLFFFLLLPYPKMPVGIFHLLFYMLTPFNHSETISSSHHAGSWLPAGSLQPQWIVHTQVFVCLSTKELHWEPSLISFSIFRKLESLSSSLNETFSHTPPFVKKKNQKLLGIYRVPCLVTRKMSLILVVDIIFNWFLYNVLIFLCEFSFRYSITSFPTNTISYDLFPSTYYKTSSRSPTIGW